MQYIPDGTEIVLWGLGEIGSRVLAGEWGDYKISFAVDRNWMQKQEEIDHIGNTGNIAVYSPDVLEDMSLGNKVLVIGVYKWDEIAADLEKKGKHIFRDYVPYIYLKYEALDIGFYKFCKDDDERKTLLKELTFGKKLCALYGACHTTVFKSQLLKSEEFTEKYCLLVIPPTNVYDHLYRDLLYKSYTYSDLDLLILSFIYPHTGEPPAPDWRTIKSWTDEKCKVILVTNAAFKGYFPQYTAPIPETFDKISRGDKNLNKLIREGKTADEILHILSSPDFYSREMVNRYYENALTNLEQMESACDVRIGDYIRKHGKQRRLMSDAAHPDGRLLKELTTRIFRKIGIDTKMLVRTPESDFLIRGGVEAAFIYPSVYHALGMTEKEAGEKLCVGVDINVKLDFSEFIDLYVKINRPYLCAESETTVSSLPTNQIELSEVGP